MSTESNTTTTVAEPAVSMLVADWAHLIAIASLGGDEQDARIKAKLAATQPPPVPPTPAAPVLSVEGDVVSWQPVTGATGYTFATILNPTTTRNTTYLHLPASQTSIMPPVVPGETVNYGLQAVGAVDSPWAKEVAIIYPEPEPEPKPASKATIGVNGGVGWGPVDAKFLLEAGLREFASRTVWPRKVRRLCLRTSSTRLYVRWWWGTSATRHPSQALIFPRGARRWWNASKLSTPSVSRGLRTAMRCT